ncbi:hypothetical protein KUTeg_007887 [Tegillarca granosa]|uniref:beta-glucosidase n=1 Tax=Tegillarca granosa TaxID=220873 RepID=A0ABQ9FGS5_TEGGR|nr:hypothetical protein KUTeg_007887 [Tegillarca granosa]
MARNILDKVIVLWICLVNFTVSVPPDSSIYYGQFPEDFIWGIGTSSYRIEGAWNKDDSCLQKLDPNLNDETGYDPFVVSLLKHYRFSISWSRVLSNGTLATRNEKGIQYYKNLISELLKNGIKPLVTLYHWDLPQALQDVGGWESDKMIDYFSDYARLMFDELGEKVKFWITFNEPWISAYHGYGTGTSAPGIKDKGHKPYTTGHVIIKAHVKAYRLYKREYSHQNGVVGIVLNSGWKEPKTQSQSDKDAAERAIQFMLGWFANPIFGNGDYPEVMKQQIADKSRKMGIPNRLPEFTEQEKHDNIGSSDFFGINTFTTNLVTYKENSESTTPSFDDDQDIRMFRDPSWKRAKSGWLSVVPWGMRKILNFIKDNYRNPLTYVTANGVSDCGQLDDQFRIEYFKTYINEVLKAIKIDQCNVKGYMAWSLMDSFEWEKGYVPKFGLAKVDFEKNERTRTLKASAHFYADLVKQNGFTKSSFNMYTYIKEDLEERDMFYKGLFPPNFAWGAATSAYQIEGGWNEDGKGPSIWDDYSHEWKITKNQTGDIACDSYHRYKEDVQMLKKLGVSHYRFSIAWSRIMADGTLNSLNKKGIDYYNNLINELLAYNIQPMVTLYHWDLPSALQKTDGWKDPEIVDKFAKYAEVCFVNFGDRVKFWITINEPFVVSWLGHGIGIMAPGVKEPAIGVYNVTHNIIKSHVKVYHLYNEKFRSRQHGKVGITLDCDWKEPLTYDAMDRYSAERSLKFKLGWFADPIFGQGDYPAVMKRFVARKSEQQGYSNSRLPEFTDEEKKQNKGAADFLGLNHYTTNLVGYKNRDNENSSYEADQDTVLSFDPCWNKSESDWLRVNPWGIRKLLKWIKNRYRSPVIYVTENGVSDDGQMDDVSRQRYYTKYINEILKSIKLDNVDVRGYMAWSLMDNFEWGSGFTQKFGLYHVDFDIDSRPRTPKASTVTYSKIIKDNGFH